MNHLDVGFANLAYGILQYLFLILPFPYPASFLQIFWLLSVIINEYFDTYFPNAAVTAQELRK